MKNLEIVATNIADDSKKHNEKIRMENGLLKHEINDLKHKCPNMDFERDELEVKHDPMNETINTTS